MDPNQLHPNNQLLIMIDLLQPSINFSTKKNLIVQKERGDGGDSRQRRGRSLNIELGEGSHLFPLSNCHYPTRSSNLNFEVEMCQPLS
jgi:hypothetical protein